MSLQSFQSALAYVLRCYESENAQDIEQLAKNYKLNNDEKFILQNLLNQKGLKAYSEELFMARWTIIRENLAFLEPFLCFKTMKQLWEHDFEAKSKNIIQEDLTLRFVEYLVSDSTGRKFISTNTQVFVPDLMYYVYKVFTFSHNILPKLKLPKDSPMTGRYFEVLKLEYDPREFFAELMELEDFKSINLRPPPQQKLSLLFVAGDQVTKFRSFEINEELANFLKAQLQGDTQAFVSCFEDLVEIGLCENRDKNRSCC